MDRRNGDEHQAPPRPPKSIPRVHRPKLPEPLVMNVDSSRQLSNTNNTCNISTQNNNSTLTTNSSTTLESSPIRSFRSPPRNLNLEVNSDLLTRQSPILGSPVTSTFTRRLPPVTTVIPTLSQTVQNLESPSSSPVTLAQPRPENERLVNEYVDTPFNRTQNRTPPSFNATVNQQNHNDNNIISSHNRLSNANVRATSPTSEINKKLVQEPAVVQTNNTNLSHVSTNAEAVKTITRQPVSFIKGLPVNAMHENFEIHPSNGDSLNSITCPQCKRCRCEECQKPRQLPSKWICGDTCLCNSETIIDYTSCLCCVKAIYFHLYKDHELEQENEFCADDPCSCSSYKCFTRWACLGILSVFLPCLLCYWPMRGCVNLCAKCYAKYSRHGCRCSPDTNKNVRSVNNLLNRGQIQTVTANSFPSGTSLHDFNQEKRLLDSNSDY
ncbi:unnamed protein product [Sphagnum compactum]